MCFTPKLLPALIGAAHATIAAHADEVTALDQAIGDGDHVANLRRGLDALMARREELARLSWPQAWQQIGMTLLSAVGGASGSLLGTLFLAMAKAGEGQAQDLAGFAAVFAAAVNAVKQRGKADVGEKTLLDVLCPVADALHTAASGQQPLPAALAQVAQAATAGMASTRAMRASKGRAAFLGERSIGHVDAGARSSQLIICALATALAAGVEAA